MLHNNRHLSFFAVYAVVLVAVCSGCNAIMNGWLTPTELGSFSKDGHTNEIRGSLSIQDTPRELRGVSEPLPEDLLPTTEEYRLVPGDVVNVFIFELRQQGVESAAQAVVDVQGRINLPVLRWVECAGLTAEELEDELTRILAERDIIRDAQVLVQFAARRGLTYTIFGNETLAVRLNRGPGVFPIPRPDFRLLDALSVSGGLSELVREVYVFRSAKRDAAQAAGAQIKIKEDLPARQELPDTPPPLPAVSFSGAVGAGMPALASGQMVQTSPSEEPPDDPNAVDPDAGDVQEILDLMLSEPGAPEAAGETDTLLAPDPPQVAPPASGQDEAAVPPNWIFLNGEWVEVTPQRAAQGPIGGVKDWPGEDAMQPVVDWDELASEEQDVRVIHISADGLRQGDPRYNIVVRAGDVIRLYSGDIGFYYMTGHVRRPGVFTFRSGATITLKNAVAAAAGLDALGWPSRVTVYRRVGDQEQMLQVDLDRIYAGQDPDFYLKKDDIVNVGTHPIAPFLIQLRNFTVPQMGGSITYFYRFIRQEVFFKNQNLDAPNQPGIFP